MSAQDNTLDVWLNDALGPARQVGTLAHDRGQIRFHYKRDWLKDPRAFALDPDLSLDEHPFFPKPELGNFGIFLDSSPDRWGQTLMKRREALQAKDEQRSPRTLYAVRLGLPDRRARPHSPRRPALSPARYGSVSWRRENGGAAGDDATRVGNRGLPAQQPAYRRSRCATKVARRARRTWRVFGRSKAKSQLYRNRRFTLDRQVPSQG